MASTTSATGATDSGDAHWFVLVSTSPHNTAVTRPSLSKRTLETAYKVIDFSCLGAPLTIDYQFHMFVGVSMAQTYAQVEEQIAALQAKAEKLKRQEVGDVIAKIKKAIAAYGITAQELFGRAVITKTKEAAKKTESARAPKYSDGAGNDWVGRGSRPQWLRDAIASGKQLADFLAGGDEKGSGIAPTAKAGKAASAKKAALKPGSTKKAPSKKGAAKKSGASRVRFTDGTNQWGGRGPQPRWLKEALAGGKSLDDLRVQ